MTLKEQVIVSAYTVVAEIKAKAKPDFLALCSGNK